MYLVLTSDNLTETSETNNITQHCQRKSNASIPIMEETQLLIMTTYCDSDRTHDTQIQLMFAFINVCVFLQTVFGFCRFAPDFFDAL